MRSSEPVDEPPVGEAATDLLGGIKLNIDKVLFVLVLIALAGAGWWLGTQWSPTGFTTEGRYSITYGLVFCAIAGIFMPKIAPKVTIGILGAFLLGLALGMLAGIFIPELIAKIPPDAIMAIVAWFNGGMILGQDWGLGPVLTVGIFAIFIVVAYALGNNLRRLVMAFWDWLQVKP